LRLFLLRVLSFSSFSDSGVWICDEIERNLECFGNFLNLGFKNGDDEDEGGKWMRQCEDMEMKCLWWKKKDKVIML
jgi:hypothetical protein